MSHILRINRVRIISGAVFFTICIGLFEFRHHWCLSPHEPIDVVYTWVNGSDPKFLSQLRAFLKRTDRARIDFAPQRFDDKNELKFSLRSLEKYAPWVRHVHIVTNGQIPSWLNLDNPRVTLVTHRQIFTNLRDLPTFSSPAIEMHLHRIPGVSKRFIYFNDDIFLNAPTYPEDFYAPNRGFLVYLAWLMPLCAPECHWIYVGDGHCDTPCNTFKCQQDGGDCINQSTTSKSAPIFKNSTTNRNFSINYINANVSDVISRHNKRIMALDKLLKRKNRRKSKIGSFDDAYTDSLHLTNRIFNENYGFTARRVPAHAPIMIDTTISAAMLAKFQREFQITSANRFRQSGDIQFAFAYYHFLMHEFVELKIEDIFNEFDTDSSGEWSSEELRAFLVKIYSLPLKRSDLHQFAEILRNCTIGSIVIEAIRTCPKLHQLLLGLSRRNKYKFDIVIAERSAVDFIMLNSNLSRTLPQLDEVRRNGKKFVCFNDNLDSSIDNKRIKKALQDFYQSIFPKWSEFELPPHFQNRYSHLDDYKKNQQNSNLFYLGIILAVVVLFKRKLCRLFNKILNF